MFFASLPSIPLLYETAEACSTESEATTSVGDFKANPKVELASLTLVMMVVRRRVV
jgi:hypothetical protein